VSNLNHRFRIGILLLLCLSVLAACNDSNDPSSDSTDPITGNETQETTEAVTEEPPSSHVNEGMSALIPGDPVVPSEATADPSATSADKARLSTLLSNSFGQSNADIPISFCYNGTTYRGFGGSSCQRDGNTIRATFNNELEVILTVTEHKDYATVTCQLSFRNLSDQAISLTDIVLLSTLSERPREPQFTYYGRIDGAAEAYRLPFRPGMSIRFHSKNPGVLGYFTLSHENGTYLFVPEGADWQLNFSSAYGATNTTGGPTVKLNVSASLTEAYSLAPNESLTTASLTIVAAGAGREDRIGDLFTAWNKAFGNDLFADSPWN